MSSSHKIDQKTLTRFAKLFYSHMDCIELSKYISEGNNKIPSTTAIFNMSSASDCPSFRLGFCKAYSKGKHICYALKAERSYRPDVLPFRRKQEKIWKSIDAKDFCEQFILLNALKKVPFDKLRLNEAGDFHGQSCVQKAEDIARTLKPYGVTTYCYTSRNDLDFSKVRNLIISGSGFMKEGISNEFRILHKGEKKPKGWKKCKGNCDGCNICSTRGNKTVVAKH